MGSCVVASPFSTQFNRVMKWLPDSSGHTALRPPHSEGGPVKCRRSGWFPLMKYQYLHLHFQPTALAGFDQTWHYIDQIKEACLSAWTAFSTPLLSAPANFCPKVFAVGRQQTEIITMWSFFLCQLWLRCQAHKAIIWLKGIFTFQITRCIAYLMWYKVSLNKTANIKTGVKTPQNSLEPRTSSLHNTNNRGRNHHLCR